MICSLFEGLSFGTQELTCLGSPYAVYGVLACLLIALLSLRLAWRMRRAKSCLPAGLFSLAALVLALAMERPALRQSLAPEETGGHILVLLDRSESFWRNEKNARKALAGIAEKIETFESALPESERSLWRGTLLTFGATARREADAISLPNLSTTLRGYIPRPPEGRSDLQAALRSVAAIMAAQGGRNMVILASDGFASEEIKAQSLDELAGLGLDFYMLALGSDRPALGLVGANIGPFQQLGAEAILRASLAGGGEISLVRPDGTQDSLALPATNGLQALRLTTRFSERGLQGVTLALKGDEGSQRRRLFTLVRGPSKLLVFGAAPWVEALPPELWQVERGDPRNPPDPAAYDVTLIDALSPQDFAPGYDELLLRKADGHGIMLINGPLRGEKTDRQRISDWNSSALDPILPVTSDPRAFFQKPPPRDIVIIVDTSGSMAGEGLKSARSVIDAILDHLRPQDTITILPFSSGSETPFPKSAATPANLQAARAFAHGLSASGGTAPSETIQQSAGFASNYCAFFFISDGYFDAPKASPLCYTTAISVSNSHMPIDVATWGEEIVLGNGGDGRAIKLSYFDPIQRDEYYRDESFQPQLAGNNPEFLAPISLAGMAITYPRLDARVESLHANPPPDPLFAWRRDSQRQGVVTAAFLGEMTNAWGHEGLAASQAMLSRLIAWTDQDRYLLRLAEGAEGLRLIVNEIEAETLGQPLSASLISPQGAATLIRMEYDGHLGAHVGRLPALSEGYRGILMLEQGGDVQRIPFVLPQAESKSPDNHAEALVFSTNSAFFQNLSLKLGAKNLDGTELTFYSPSQSYVINQFYPLLISIGFALLGLSVWSREFSVRS